jgi:O-acetyl-ADP-ribose deacetylase (regulator of RNase III)
MKLHFVDLNPEVVAAWRISFAPFPEVEITHTDLLSVARHCVVSPANSYGFMDGGIDRAYLSFFGDQLGIRVQEAIGWRPEGILPVGAAELVLTGNARIPYMIVAPTMLMPEHVPALSARRALKAALRVVTANPEIGRDVYCPGLTTGVGAVSADEAAEQMAAAYAHWKCP